VSTHQWRNDFGRGARSVDDGEDRVEVATVRGVEYGIEKFARLLALSVAIGTSQIACDSACA
jgi:hypothetical protein